MGSIDKGLAAAIQRYLRTKIANTELFITRQILQNKLLSATLKKTLEYGPSVKKPMDEKSKVNF